MTSCSPRRLCCGDLNAVASNQLVGTSDRSIAFCIASFLVTGFFFTWFVPLYVAGSYSRHPLLASRKYGTPKIQNSRPTGTTRIFGSARARVFGLPRRGPLWWSGRNVFNSPAEETLFRATLPTRGTTLAELLPGIQVFKNPSSLITYGII